MLTFPTITASGPRLKSQDYAALRELGIAELQALAGTVWTDYNLHDPGVTLLEALIYAITDLGYRLDNSIPVLLASHPDGPIALEQHFHPAHVILPNCPYTPQDYRKYFLDIPGVQNIFLKRAKSLCPFLYCRTEERAGTKIPCEQPFPSLSFNRDVTVPGWEIKAWERLQLNGLYCLNLILEPEVIIDVPYQSLLFNLGAGTVNSYINVNQQIFQVTVYLPAWQNLDLDLWADPGSEVKEVVLVKELKLEQESTAPIYSAEVKITFSGQKEPHLLPVKIQVRPESTPHQPRAIPRRIPVLPTARDLPITIHGGQSLTAVLAIFLTNIQTNGLIPHFQKQVIKASDVIRAVKNAYCVKRNLCEDIECLELCRPQDVVVKAAIDLKTQADPEHTIAAMLFGIDQYLSPWIRFHTLAELLKEEIPVEKIYEGPLLRHGFITDEDIARMDPKTAVYNSDLIRIMACEAGVIAIRNLLTCSFIGTDQVVTDEKNCFLLERSACYHFRLDIDRSLDDDNICCFQVGVRVDLDVARVKVLFKKLKDALPKRVPQNDYLSLPEGKVVDLENWYSVQYELPRVYGIGAAGLPKSAGDFRHGRAKQFKGFLMFFEQIMANYLSQLSHVGSLFSMESTVNRSYFFQSLYDLPAIAPLFKARLDSGQSWDAFIADAQNDYMEALEKAAEDFMGFLERRNRFLDHLLARLGEDVINYENWVRSYYRNDPEFVLLELIRVKQRLLKYYPRLSAPRGTAFAYCKKKKDKTPDVWDTDNVSGYEKRVCAKLGLYNCQRRNLCNAAVLPDVFEIFDETDQDNITEWWFRLRDDDGTILMTASDRYTSYTDLIDALKIVARLGMYRDNYFIKVSSDGKYYFILKNGTDTLARRIPGFPTLEAAEAAIARIMEILWKAFNGEGLHLVEHILLRPRTVDYTLLQPFQCGAEKRRAVRVIKDPYSFVMTICLPSGFERDFSNKKSVPQATECSPRLRDTGFREVVETVLREEAPAHIYLSVFWLDRDNSGKKGSYLSLNRFELLYRKWLEKLDTNATTLKPANDNLVDYLNQLLPVIKRPA